MTRLRILYVGLLLLSLAAAKAQTVEISPQTPHAGDTVTVIYHAGRKGAAIGTMADSVAIKFTYSTFYDLPWKLPMTRRGNDWIASFEVKPYATFTTFYFQSGAVIDKPGPERHYFIAVYNGNKRVLNGYLHESYSLSAQRPKSPDLLNEKIVLLNKELSAYPDNYEAKIRLESVRMAQAKTPEDNFKHREAARRLIAGQFEKDPLSMDNLNKVTMGYLIIGENSRLDSIRDVVIRRYPHSELGRQLLVSCIAKEKDPDLKIAELEKLLKEADSRLSEASQEIHGILFDYYAAKKDINKATMHARLSLGPKDPYTPRQLKEIAEVLTDNELAPDTAISYARRSLAMVNEWPAGLILHFPKYGHIRTFVADSTRRKVISEAKSSLFALVALNEMYKGARKQALTYILRSESESQTVESLTFIARAYEYGGEPERAFSYIWKALEKNPSDTASVGLAREFFLKFNPSVDAFNEKLLGLDSLKFVQLKRELGQHMMNLPRPDLDSITDLEGKKVTKEMMTGKVVVLDFWATWCVPCMQELPYLQKVYERYKNDSRVQFMVVNSGAKNTINDAISWKKKNSQYTFPIFFNHDPDIGEKMGFAFIPTVAILDSQGRMQFRTVGFEGEGLEKKISASIEVLLE